MQGEWRSFIEIWNGDRPLYVDRQVWAGSEALWASPHALSGEPVVGSMVYVGRPFLDDEWSHLRGSVVVGRGEFRVGRLRSGLVARYRGASTSEAAEAFESLRSAMSAGSGCSALR